MARIALAFPETRYPSGQIPLGIAYLAAYLRRQGHGDLQVIDTTYQKRPMEYVERILKQDRFDWLGLSVVTPHLREARQISALARRLQPEARIVWGGPHPSVLPEQTLADPNVDLVVVGEGEMPLTRLVAGDDPAAIPGVAYRQNGQVVQVPLQGFIADLDTVPFPARDLFDMETYMRTWYSMDVVSLNLRGTSVMASRGCPYKCTFCQPTIASVFGWKDRRRSPANVVAELEQLIRDYRLSAFMFEDSTFHLKRQWVEDLCRSLIDARLGLKWCCNLRVDLWDEELLALMHQAGLRKINLGIESGVQRVLDEIIDKRIKLDQVGKLIGLAHRLQIKVQGYFMLGAVGETLEEIKTTLRFARNLDVDDAVFDITTPFPGTYLYERTKQYITLDLADFDCFQRSVYTVPGGVPARTIERLKKLAYWQFYWHPKRALRTLLRLLSPVGLRRTLIKAKRV